MKICKEVTFDAAHYLTNYEGKCKNLHGHTYKVKAYFANKDDSADMVMDFNECSLVLKAVLEDFDHHLLLSLNSDDVFERDLFALCMKYDKAVYLIKGRTTVENIAKDLAARIDMRLDENISLEALEVYETATSHVYVERGFDY